MQGPILHNPRAKSLNIANTKKKKDGDAQVGDIRIASMVGTEASMNTLILWNISKALQRNPLLDLKAAIKDAHDRLDNTRDVNKIITQSPEERHLACAFLAWQELGHSTADSLYRFIEEKLDDHERAECEKMTQNAKIKIISPADESENDKSVNNLQSKHLECTHKSNQDSKSIPIRCIKKNYGDSKCNLETRTQKSQVNNDNFTHLECIHVGHKESESGQAMRSHLSNKESKPSVNCTHETENAKKGESKSSYHVHNVLNNEGTIAHDSSFCIFNDPDGKEGYCSVSKCPFITAACSNSPIYRRVSVDNCDDCENYDNFDTGSLKGPVVTLPPETKVVMRFDNQSTCGRHQGKKPREAEKNVMKKIDAACCMDSACAERLMELDKATIELRNRAAKLARREAERAELLERAEAAWKDLELGYQRRLALAEEKEYDIAKQTKKLIEDRNSYKVVCLNLAKVLKERGEATEKDRQNLVQVEKEMCALACVRMRLSEEAARSDAVVTEQHIKVAQLDRDLQFKEEQTRRKLVVIQGEVDSVRALTVEVERALRAELAALREQVETVSKQLLKEDNDNIKIKAELESLRSEKLGLVEDLEGCQGSCDLRMQKKMDELKKAKERLAALKDKVMECKCKIPIDAAVTAKRTPSLAALCTCSPEDKLLESCSCTSLRSQLLSNLLSDLFGGLQAELGDVAIQMPCQYLKCLEDKHNWDKGSLVKSNLRSYFSKLLIGELDIAIATAIEKYHAKWVGISCVDTMRSIPDTDTANTEGWQERAIERRAQKLANKLAEQLFQERADKLVERAKDAVKSGPPPCDCKQETAVFPCFVNQPTLNNGRFIDKDGPISTYWRKTYKDVTQLRVQIEDLKKESLKKEDLKIMEEKIFQIVQRPSEYKSPMVTKEIKPNESNNIECTSNKETKSLNRTVNTETVSKHPAQLSKHASIRKKNVEVNSLTKKNPRKVLNEQTDRFNKHLKKLGPVQAFAVNTCFCGNQNPISKLAGEDIPLHKSSADNEDKALHKQSRTMSNQISSPKPLSVEIETNFDKNKTHKSCTSGCICFHKIPSNTSIDKLFEKLTEWKSNLIATSGLPDSKSKLTTTLDTNKTQQKDYEFNKSERGIQPNLVYHVSRTKFISDISKNTSTDVNTNLLTNATESEYMGAINLEKSNDQCKCTSTKQQKINKKEDNSSSLFKCINSESCECKKSSGKRTDILNPDKKKSRLESSKRYGYINDSLLKMKTNVSSNNENQRLSENDNKVDHKTETAINQIVKSSDLFPSDCDYYVKLLGVTLANISSQKVFDDKNSISNRKHKTELPSISNLQTFNDSLKNGSHGNEQLNVQSCQCHVEFDQFKNYMENNFKKQRGDHLTSDKKLDVPSFKEVSLNNELPCICCNSGTKIESKELEVNTFYLLEEYLRSKLEELKHSCCKFSILPFDEEEKLFSTILQRVKHIISTSTNEISCNCKEGKHSNGNWNRANTLLQEYLKTKIKRVQCLCGNDNQKQDCVLPKVLDEIYSLIEKDFQRLKNVCKSQDVARKNKMNEVRKDEVPEKDINDELNKHEIKISFDTNLTNDIEKLTKSNSNKSIILKQSMSAQVPLNLGMATKSCDAMEKETKNVQTSESMKSVTERGYNSVEIDSCNCNSKMSTFGTPEVLVNHHIYKVKNNGFSNYSKNNDNNIAERNKVEHNEKSSCPYIGYTVDCSCKCALGTCTCIKSTVMRNNNQITNLWNDLTKDHKQSKNYTYIMNNVSKKHKNRPANNKLHENSISHRNQRSKNIESNFFDEGEEIVLKSSNRNIMVSNNSANTSNSNLHICDNKLEVEKDDICECRVKPILKSNIRSESHLSYPTNMHKTQSLSCDCNLVPVCHVKMLVDNIENKFFHSKCTCDSLNARVCPVHSKSLY